MIRKLTSENQQNLFNSILKEFINLSYELALLADKMDWQYFEDEFSDSDSKTGKPAMPIR